MKFGGTSVQDVDAVARLVRIVSREGGSRVVVVSALSKVTDALLGLLPLLEGGQARAVQQEVGALRLRHAEMVAGLRSTAGRAALLASLDLIFDELASMVKAEGGGLKARSVDALVALGELASSRIVAATLDDAGLEARFVDARCVLVTDDQHGAALPDPAATRARLSSLVRPLLDQGRIPVLGGFIGATPDGRTTTLGRGGSDYSAALFGAGLEAAEIQIWTDVDGMLTADPRLVAEARLVPRLTFDEASELAYFGAKVLHPSTILPAVDRASPSAS